MDLRTYVGKATEYIGLVFTTRKALRDEVVREHAWAEFLNDEREMALAAVIDMQEHCEIMEDFLSTLGVEDLAQFTGGE